MMALMEEDDAGGTRCQWEGEEWAAAGLDPSGWAGSNAGSAQLG